MTKPPASAAELAARLDERLADDDAERVRRFPGPATQRRPVHTVYVPADRFHAATASEWGRLALASLDEHGPLPETELVEQAAAVRAKLATEPIEDLRIDFEDGYGVRPDADEDDAATGAATALAASMADGTVTPFVGLRIKSFDPAVRRRGVRTLDRFLSVLVASAELPVGFRVTLPKVTSVGQVKAMVDLCSWLEASYGLAAGTLRFEIQVETSQAVIGPDGTAMVAPMIHAAAGRCVGLHYGVYDYSAALGVAPHQQSLEHPVADHAKVVMQVAAAGTAVAVSDGSINVLPVGGTADVRSAWSLHARLVTRSLERGIYQGWDLHPAQLPTRYAATYAFYRVGLVSAASRLQGYLDRQESGIAEEPATARALADFLLRALQSGAVADDELFSLCRSSRPDLARLVTRW